MPLEPKTTAIADACLDHLVANPETLGRFLAETGMDPADLRSGLGTPALARGLIDYVVANEPVLLAVCAEHGFKPEAIMSVWHRLNPGH